MMNDLLEAVEALTRVRHVQIDTDDGPRWVTGEPRLALLQDYVTAAMGSGGGSAGLASERSPLSPEALMRAMTITSQIGDWCRMAGIRVTRDPITDLDRWHVARIAQNAESDDFYITQMRKWATEIDGMIDRPRPLDITVACPVCGESSFEDDLGDICAWPLKGYADPFRVECKSCGIEWDGPDAAEELADEIGVSPDREVVLNVIS